MPLFNIMFCIISFLKLSLNSCGIYDIPVSSFFVYHFLPGIIYFLCFYHLYLRIDFVFSTIVHHLLCFGNATNKRTIKVYTIKYHVEVVNRKRSIDGLPYLCVETVWF